MTETKSRRVWWVAAIGLVALWFVCRPYVGVDGDARLYVGRVLADRDPGGLGLDMAFAHDGQSGFSVFPRLLGPVIAGLGVGPGAMALSALGLCLWFAAAAFLLSRLFSGRLLWAALACVAALPSAYGGFAMFDWGEAIATPRIFAEACGLAALALLLDERRLAALALALAGAAFHPIMVIPVLGSGFLYLAGQDRRWWWLAVLGAVGALAAALAHLPVADRLLAPFDPAWRRVIAARSPQVFPQLWPLSSWGPVMAQAATVLVAWSLAEGRLRRLALATGLTAVAGVAASTVLQTELPAQLQLWRTLWLLSWMAAALFAFVGVALWKRGPAGQAALAMLAIAWVGRDNPALAAVAALLSLALRFDLAPQPFQRRWATVAWSLAGLFVGLILVQRGVTLARSFAPLPGEFQQSASTWLRTDLQTVAAAGVAVAVAMGAVRGAWLRPAAVAGAIVLVALAVLKWDDRTAVARAREAGAGAPALRARLTGPGEVYWLDGSGTNWLWTGRPEWWSQTQGAGVVFDRTLALTWDARLSRLIAAGLQTPADRRIYQMTRKADPKVGASALARLCAERDAPRWIVAPLSRLDAATPAASRWTAPAAEYQRAADGRSVLAARDYAVFDCAALRVRQSTQGEASRISGAESQTVQIQAVRSAHPGTPVSDVRRMPSTPSMPARLASQPIP